MLCSCLKNLFVGVYNKYFVKNYELIEDDWVTVRNKKPIEIKIH